MTSIPTPPTASRPIPQRALLLIMLVAALVMLPSFLFGPGASHSSSYNFIWTAQFGDAIRHGTFYPRWLPDSFEGLGAPTFYFYPPIAFWVSGSLNAIGVPTLQAVNLAAFLFLLISGLTMYIWLSARQLPATLGAILYMIAPYHLVDFWIRGALAEFAAFIWLPLIALAIDRLPERRGVWLLAGSYAALIMTHLPVAMITGFFLIAPLILFRAYKDRRVLLPAAIAGLFAVGLASFYLIPALTLQDHISSGLLWRPYFQPSSWSIFSPMALNRWNLFPAIAVAALVFAFPLRSVWSFIIAITGLSAMGLVPFIWDVPPLDHAQFPWRALGIAEFAVVTALLIRRPRWPQIAIALAAAAIPYGVMVDQAVTDIRTKVDYAEMRRTMPDAGEYLPAGFDFAATRSDDHWPNLSSFAQLSRDTIITVRTPGRITLRHAAFPIWRIYRDGREVPSTGPLISFDATPGTYHVQRVMLWQEALGYAISLTALLLALLAHGRTRLRRRKLPSVNQFR